jgi:hypothetical protein
MSTRLIVLPVLAALLFAVPASADAASVTSGRGCFVNNGTKTAANLEITGFVPSSVVRVSLDGVKVVDTQVGADGSLAGSIPVPALSSGVQEMSHNVTVTDGTTTVTTPVRISRITADITPSAGNPKTLKVSFSAFGMNLVKSKQKVYVHYITPGGKLKKTIMIGTAQGPCGHILKTKKRKLFNFTAQRGTWTLQTDTSKKYHKRTSRTTYPAALYKVKIKRIFLR